ncbi:MULTISPECIES: pantoate--beta-alanine ligase [Acidobacterium]|uniref:Pantothenate synthetase n=1 Tax=Acidobacterium capsulatum (strain ATCC 51196 / DSM 11244 / BCRC 80197 / JCM 7670 / NBRC 15755 / NCIMB 13165 / 161) TaxID=240015 RepID=PANC_ACIC5|nr:MULTISPECIES: pantoate--beta-alanine ligase [Acidobacterium]C1F8U3.1 RecName: Full=Pantothenate synthetase; Short=PS; AltName: Full=Pantoate--beta-alanine ligase; AltName: Full=Pantoate-activating enzyme [Acidobacterium capsulatum ATCC 51196]ACO33519.1 pantoate--beta-alanine ligase [Acidobacterium capsulatum ATCC 51196]HCT59867.1 pantoate--beta-alanine ligase [Acidobacterium sp.]
MRRAETIAEIRAAVRELRYRENPRLKGETWGTRSIGFVPTMGALHEGHLSLVRAAKAECDAVVASIFVNPTQFGPNEDFGKYPRTVEADCALLEREGVDAVFLPQVEEMYPAGATTWVEVEELSGRLDGASRPGHFRGVATVVAKLFHIVGPDRAYFGQKDAAQVANLRRMVRDLDFDLEVVVCPIVREADGLAMSSRNRYLSVEERRQGLVLSRALRAMEAGHAAGERDGRRLLAAGASVMAEEPAVRVDYLRVVDPETLVDVEAVSGPALATVAAYVGATRLIDNVLLGETPAAFKL